MFWSKRRHQESTGEVVERSTPRAHEDGEAVANELGLLWGGVRVTRVDDLATALHG